MYFYFVDLPNIGQFKSANQNEGYIICVMCYVYFST